MKRIYYITIFVILLFVSCSVWASGDADSLYYSKFLDSGSSVTSTEGESLLVDSIKKDPFPFNEAALIDLIRSGDNPSTIKAISIYYAKRYELHERIETLLYSRLVEWEEWDYLYSFIESLEPDGNWSGNREAYGLLAKVNIEIRDGDTQLINFIINRPYHEVHELLSNTISDKPQLQRVMSEQLILWLNARVALNSKNWPLTEEIISQIDWSNIDLLDSPYTYLDLRRWAATNSRVVNEILPVVYNTNNSISDRANFGLYVSLASISRANKSYNEAYKNWGIAIEYSEFWDETLFDPSVSTLDELLWYQLEAAYDISTTQFLTQLEISMRKWENGYYFDDLLESILAKLIRERNWSTIYSLRAKLVQFGDSYSAVRYSWISARASHWGYISITETEKNDLYSYCRQHAGDSYYGFMSGATLSEWMNRDEHSVQGIYDSLIILLLDRGYSDKAAWWGYVERANSSIEVQRMLANSLYDEDQYRRAINLILGYSRYHNWQFEAEDLPVVYPYPYKEFIDYYAEENDLPIPLFCGLIRIESAFDKHAVSYAGAVGLTQLMPATAAEWAEKLDIENPDSEDPETSIEIGTRFIRWLRERAAVDNWGDVLIGYNAGPGNLRNWKESNGDLPDELFWESVPSKQARNYVRKVFSAGAYYDYLYYGGETIKFRDSFYLFEE